MGERSEYVPGKRVIGKKGGTVIAHIPKNPSTFNPYAGMLDANDKRILNQIYRSPMRYDIITQKVEPEVAESLAQSADGKTFLLKLRPNLKWSDGTPVTAGDIIFNLDIAINLFLKDNFKDSKGELPIYEQVDGDNRTVRFQYKNSPPSVAHALTKLLLIPHHLWREAQQQGKLQQVLTTGEDPKRVVGLGPFKLRACRSDQIVIFERNDYFWKRDAQGTQLPYLDRLVFKIIPEPNITILNLAKGEIELYDGVKEIDAQYIQRNQEAWKVRLYDGGPANDYMYFTFNQHPGMRPDGKPKVKPYLRELFVQRKFREAVSWAIDRHSILTSAVGGVGEERYCVESRKANPNWAIDCEPTPHNPKKASQLLDEMGLVDRDKDGVRETQGGEPLSFHAMVRSKDEMRGTALELVRSDLEKVGIRLLPNVVDQGLFMNSVTATHDWESMLTGTYRDDPHPTTHDYVWLSSGRLHFWYPQQPSPATDWEAKVDEKMLCAATSSTNKEQYDCFAEAQRILNAERPIIPLVGLQAYVAASNNLGNVVSWPYLIRGVYNTEEIFRRD